MYNLPFTRLRIRSGIFVYSLALVQIVTQYPVISIPPDKQGEYIKKAKPFSHIHYSFNNCQVNFEMIKVFLESLEDPKRPLFGPNYWLMNKIGLLRSKKFQHGIFKDIIAVISTVFVITQYFELYVIRADIDRVITNLRISMLSTMCVVKAITFVFWQDNWRQIIDYITDADEFERNNQDEIKARIINSYTKYCRRITYFFWALTFTTCLNIVTMPLIKLYASREFREGYLNGTEYFPHVFSSWVPYDKEHFPGNCITVVYHIVCCSWGSTVGAAYDSGVTVVLVFFAGKLELLRIRCREMLGTNGRGISDKQADSVVRELHQIHMILLKHSRLFDSVLSPVMFVYVLMCTILICTSAYQFTAAATNISQKLFIAQYLVFVIAQLFLYCWHSNYVIDKSSEVVLGPYECDWWAANLQQRKKVLLLQGQMRIEHMYTAGPFTNLTLATFINILKGAYSYYTLLNQSRQ